MITSTTHIKRSRDPRRPRGRSAGFTLMELHIGVVLSAIILAGVMSAFLLIGRSSMTAVNYSVAVLDIRRGVEELSRDLRMAKAITWNSATSVTLIVPDNYASTSNQVTYAYDASTSGATAQTFYRLPGAASSTAPKTVLVRNVTSFSFSRFNRQNNAASTDAETKRVRITLNVRRTAATLVAANTLLVSASYTLRNKAIN